MQRILRDEFSARIVELQRSYQELAEQAKKDVASTYEQQVERAKKLRTDLEQMRALRGRLTSAGGAK